jgi:hypothetical protein
MSPTADTTKFRLVENPDPPLNASPVRSTLPEYENTTSLPIYCPRMVMSALAGTHRLIIVIPVMAVVSRLRGKDNDRRN